MIGIEQVGVYLPKNRISNYDRKEQFGIDNNFIENKIGFKSFAVKDVKEETSDLCVKAYENLIDKVLIDKAQIEAIIVVTQNPDFNIPHTSAIVHGKLDMPSNCAAFDISLGCSGFVYALSILEGFMNRNNMSKALLFTADPYSKIVSPDDKNTAMLFGDGAAVTLVSNNPRFVSGRYTFGTLGEQHQHLICKDGVLNMNGRAIFDFAARSVPKDVKKLLEINDLNIEDVDVFLMHQGSKFIIDTLAKRLRLSEEKLPFLASKYGNTVSATIPILLEKYFNDEKYQTIGITGFGVGLSWSSTVLSRIK